MPRNINTTNTLTVPNVESIKNTEDVKSFLRKLTLEMQRNHIYFRNDISNQLKDGVSGWFDDGSNFRITVVDGVITNIGDSVLGGHS